MTNELYVPEKILCVICDCIRTNFPLVRAQATNKVDGVTLHLGQYWELRPAMTISVLGRG